MATLFLDFENGNDNYAGTSFAPLAQGTNGRITSTTFSSAGASFPNDGSLIGQYLSIFNGTIYAVYNITAWVSSTSLTIAILSGGTALANQAVDRQYYIGGRWKNITTGATSVRTVPGDTIRIMGSPAPTSLGQNGVWTSQALQATKSITSSTNATPIAITCTAHGYSTGDTVVITGHTTNTNANGTWEITSTGANTFTLDGSVGNGVGGASGNVRLRNNTRVKLTSAVTQNIASTGPGRTAWVASANVTATLDTGQFKQHTNSDSISIADAFVTGKAAYWALPSATDFSSYQQVSFWIRQVSAGTALTASTLSLRLCSDATGNTTVNTINIPAIPAFDRWTPVTVDLGSNLGSSIQSIALYVDSDQGGKWILLNNIIACKASSAADSLTLTSLIGKNTTGETFWGIQSINGTRVMLDADTNQTPVSTTVRGYYGTSETVTTWKRETIKQGPAAAATTALQTIQGAGTDGSPITYSGGWDRTAMSTQNLETWLDGVNGNGYGITNGRAFIDLEKIAFTRLSTGYNASSSSYCNGNFIAGNNCTTSTIRGAFSFSGDLQSSLTVGHANANASVGISSVTSSSVVCTIENAMVSNGGTGVWLNTAVGTRILKGGGAGLLANNGTQGILVSVSDLFANGIIFENNGVSSVGQNTSYSFSNYYDNCLFSDANEFQATVNLGNSVIYSQKHDQTAGNHRITFGGGVIVSATDERKTASGISWKMQPTSTTACHSRSPIVLSLAKVAVSANSLVTIKAWMRRDNAGLTMRLVCKGGQIAGVASDVTSSVTTTSAWEEETITFTPTETGVVEITAEAWGGTTFSGWVDDMTISQA